MPLPHCTRYGDCEAQDQKRVEVIGAYRVWSPSPGGTAKSRHVKIAFETSGGPFLEAGSDPRHMRSPDEIARFSEKKVRVIGRFVREMPRAKREDQAQLGGSCISDVESIEIIE